MPKRKYFRHIYLDEWKEASEKLKAKYPSGALPDFRNVWVQVESIEDCRCTHTPNEHTLDNWPENEPRCIYTNITQYPDRQIIYTKTKVVYGNFGKPWLTAFKRAIRFLDKWEKRKVRVEMPCVVPSYRVQGSESEAVN